MSSFTECQFVYFDLEATGLTIPPDIIQVGAVTQDGSRTFDEYVQPTKQIEAGAAKVIGIHTDEKLNMYLTETKQKFCCRSARKVLTEFLDWLRTVAGGRKVALVAYNAFRFDAIVLLYHLER